ncbi:ATP-binding protein [Dyella tabacisoli]|uniref:ATP-binding protein n=1 Tax=Dyella tabacisoli TaxID=2282381 RepID=A0A369UI70_9GAMM|nr:SbcC/MukB-like Walker B domain-containing protein [Dyella tabacisoli]RDD80246.1 ATP-binding protein [Dyella tabacisoli]
MSTPATSGKRVKAAVTESLFLSDLPNPRDEQFRMRRLQVCNWGTFSGLFEIPIAERGFLFVGRSGSGKSTLLDAMSALLVPPSLIDFNAAAREAERSGRDRSLASYVRGAWADQQDADSGEIATQYLRKGATWSALVLEYRNALGATVSLIRLFWIAGNSSASADVRKHYMVVERAFDIATELEGFDLDLRRLKSRLSEDVSHFDSFTGYAERFRRLLGIGNDMALKLLHKTQSAKNLGDLNQFLRGFMLDEPETFAAAERLVTDFAELDAAHKAVVTAREQVSTLAPARDDYSHLLELRRSSAELRELQLGLDPYREQRRLALIDARLELIATEDLGHAGEEKQRSETLANHDDKLAELERQRREQGGDRIDELERERERVQRERDERVKRRGTAEQACKVLGQDLAGTAQGFAEQIGTARQLLEDGRGHADALDERIAERLGEKRDCEKRFGEVRAEIQSLKLRPSNIPAHAQALRTRMCEAIGVSEQALPFVGELLQVCEDDAAWRGAIERVLHGFAQSMLVDEKHHKEVADWVNRTHLAGKLVYYRVGRGDALPGRKPDMRSLVHKLDIRDHAHREWLGGELAKRFDYTCVDSASGLRKADKAITREGQIKHPGDRFEKDDRRAIDDRKNWLLGFDSRDKLHLFEREGFELAKRMGACDEEASAIRQQRERGQQQQLASHTLVNLGWDEIDIAPKLHRLADIEDQLRQLREGDATLRELGERIERARVARDTTSKALAETRSERMMLARERAGIERERDTCVARQTVAPTPFQIDGLNQLLAELSALSLLNLGDHFRTLERGLNEQLEQFAVKDNALTQRVVDSFRDFRRRWPQDSGDFTPTLDSAEDFLARLRRLEMDGLPKHEARFFELLQTQSKNNLHLLQRYMGEARKSIAQRMDEVNASLEQVPFNRGTLLTIELSDRRLPEVIEFQQQLRDVLSHHQTEDRDRAEAQFAVLRSLVQRLGAQEPELRRWREQVLDVRLHVEFFGVELDAQTRAQVEIYRSGAGKSGGQRQKLATTCLAAALRYQLGGDDGEMPRYAAVVLDEAFDKADNEFTALAMNIFENFGFQMIVATPLKSVMTLEPFIGGACFVEINGRHDSGVLLIEYDQAGKRLQLPERVREADVAI